MKLAVNYSSPLINLIKNKTIQLDLIKCPDWDGMLSVAEGHGQVTIHFDMDAGLGNTFNVDFARIRALMDRTFTPHVNTHLVTPKHFDPDNPVEVEKIKRLWRDEILLMIDHFGSDAVALEQFPYTESTPNIKVATEEGTFSQVINDTGCRLLLDLSHAAITADTRQIDVRDYIRALPLERLAEIHINGIKPYNGVLTDHFELGPQDWDLLEWALDEISSGHWRKPEIVAFEYGGVGQTFMWRTNPEVLKTQVPILYKMVHGLD